MGSQRLTWAVLLIVLALSLFSTRSSYSFTTAQGATVVLGQTGFTTSTSATTTSGLSLPTSVAFDSSGNLWVVDSGNNRVLEYTEGNGFTTGQAASVVIGQSGFGSAVAATTASGLNSPTTAVFDSSGDLWVTDTGNNRVLKYVKGAGFTTGQAASLVIGQTNFTSAGFATTATGLKGPIGMTFDASGDLWVSDISNSRVLEYTKGNGFTTGQAASLVIGQANFTSSATSTTATGLDGAYGVAFDLSGNLWVADGYQNRVLEYLKGTGFVTGQAASVVIGQSGFGSAVAATTATGLSSPLGIAFDSSGNLWIADLSNSRVLEYLKGAGFTTGQAASLVIGQASFTSSGPSTTAAGLRFPYVVTFDASGNLWVADLVNNRVVGFAESLQGVTTTTLTSTATSTTNSTLTTVSTTVLTSVSTATSTATVSSPTTLTLPTTVTTTSISTTAQGGGLDLATSGAIAAGTLVVGAVAGYLLKRRG